MSKKYQNFKKSSKISKKSKKSKKIPKFQKNVLNDSKYIIKPLKLNFYAN